MTILIIEDDTALSELIKEKVEECGYETACVDSAKEAFDWLSGTNPHLMLLDYTLPDMTAKEFIIQLKSKGEHFPPFIVSTGQGDPRIAVDMMKLGARDYIVKDSQFLDMLPEVIRKVERDIDNENRLRDAEEALRKKEEKIRILLDSAAEAIYGIDMDGNCTFSNNSCVKMLGYNHPDDLIGKNMHWQIHGKYPDGSIFPVEDCRIFKAFQLGIGTHVDDEVLWRSDGTSFPAEYWSYPQLADGEVIGAVVTFLDITDRKHAEEKIKKLLDEKELILKEVHHRIKNNMNTIKSLLFLQAENLTDQSSIAALRDAESRVESMMVLYDKLYRSTDFIEMSIKGYLPVLIDEIVGNFSNKKIVKIEKYINDFILDADILFPIGILVNELLTNIMKYAFIGRESGLVIVTADLDVNHVRIVIKDNGVGIPESISFEKLTGFGLDLVAMLAQQIGGSIRIERGGGTAFILEFDL
jgi:PAS domain S-box-containing protein